MQPDPFVYNWTPWWSGLSTHWGCVECGTVADANLLEEEIGGPDGYVYVGDLHWWTTDADLEQECRRFGRVKDIKFFEDGLNGKSKGAAKVTFSAQQAAALCLAEMNG